MDDFGFPVSGEPGHGEVDRRAARLFLEVETQSVLPGPACRVRERDIAMVNLQDRPISWRVLEFVGDAGFRGLNRPRECEPSQDVAFLDRGLPGTPLRRNDAGLPAELERPSDLRFDPTPSAKPTGEVLNPEKPTEQHGSRSPDLHPEVVIEGHRALLLRSVIR